MIKKFILDHKKTLLMLLVIFLVALLTFVIQNRNDQENDVMIDGGGNIAVEDDALTTLSPLDDSYSSAPEDLPDVDITSWEYVLANKTNTYSTLPQVKEIGSTDRYFDYRAVDALTEMISACREAGNTLNVNLAYVPYDTQATLFNNKVEELAGDSEDSTAFEDAAAKTVPRAGQSDHQTALGVDFTDTYYYPFTEETLNTDALNWLREHCAEYGFIQRYPSGKEGITGYLQPCHFRYVGTTAAEYITSHDLSLEEFIVLCRNKLAQEAAEEEETQESS